MIFWGVGKNIWKFFAVVEKFFVTRTFGGVGKIFLVGEKGLKFGQVGKFFLSRIFFEVGKFFLITIFWGV